MSTSLIRVKSRVRNQVNREHDFIANYLTPVGEGNCPSKCVTYVTNPKNHALIASDGNTFGAIAQDHLSYGPDASGVLKLDVSGNVNVSANYYINNRPLIPYGTIIQSAAVNTPAGWINCDGTSYPVATYRNLYNAIGYTFGGSGANFNVPDLRGRVGVGIGTGTAPYATVKTLGGAGGEEKHLLSISEIPSHTHTINRASNSDAGAFDTGNSHAADNSAATTDRAFVGTFSPTSVGGGNSHNIMQPYLGLRYLISY